MSSISLVKKLTWGIVALTTILVALTTLSIGLGIFLLFEQSIKSSMLVDARKILTEYVTVSDNEIKQKVQSEQPSLGMYLRSRDLSLLIISSTGEAIARYGLYHDLPKEYLEIKKEDESKYYDKKIPNIGYVDLYTLPVVSQGKQYGNLQILRRNREVDILGNTLKTATIILLPFSWSLALLLGWVMAKRFTRPISEMVNEITSINPENLHEIKVNSKTEEEIKIISSAVNNLITKLITSYRRQSQITENISHEFKTPLTRITSNLQVRKFKEAEYEAIQLGTNVDALLSLALWERDENAKCNARVIINELGSEIPDNIKKVIKLPTELEITLPKAHAQIILRNIIDNAVKHNKKGGYIHISGKISGTKWEVKVANSSTSIPNIKKVILRKYKGEQSLGSGIGMAIVRDLCKLYQLELNISTHNNEVEVKVSN